MVKRCWWLVVFVSFGACFSPSFNDNAIQCGPNGECPPGLECVSSVCRFEGTVAADVPISTFPLTVTASGNGSGTVTSAPTGINCGGDCTETYTAGTMVTLTAAASAGSSFVGWSGACSGNGACVVTIAAATNVTANFALHDTLIVTRAGNGSGVVTSTPAGINCGTVCTQQYAPNTAVVLTAAPATGSTFDGWAGACTGIGPCILTIDAAKMVTATFSLTQYTLTVVKAGNGAGTVTAPSVIDCGLDCDATVDYGSMLTLTAAPTTGSTFTGWTGGGCSGTGTCMVTVTAASTVTATFALTTHLLTVTKAGNGAGLVTSNPLGINCGTDCTETYDYNTVVTLSAAPSTGSVFTGWTGAGCSGTAACIVTMTTASSVTATFTLTTPTLTVAKDGNGSGTVSSDITGIDCGTDCSEPFNYNTTVRLTAAPAAGTTFIGWSGGGCAGFGICAVSVTAATTVTATFTLTTHTLTVGNAGTGSGTITGAGIGCPGDCTETYNYGTSVTLSAAPTAGSTFNGWTGGGCGGTGSCVVSMTMAHTVTATFTLSTHLLTVSKTGTGSGTVTSDPTGISCGTDCTELYGFGTNVTLTATPTPGSVFSGWSGAGCSGIATCMVPVNTAETVTATFTLTTQNLTVSLNGAGTVTSSPGGINCGGDCLEAYNYGTVVTLTATANAGSSFIGWTGGSCETAGTGPCNVTVTATTTVTAKFQVGSNSLTVTKDGTGGGAVTSNPAGIDCGIDCAHDFTNGTVVVLTATPEISSVFTGWSGGGCGGTGTCTVTIGAAVTITATFTLTSHRVTVSKAGTGSGTVTSSEIPQGINCGLDCDQLYNYGTTVTLLATPTPGSTFVGWSGAGAGCVGTGTCDVFVTGNTSVTATFDLIQHSLVVSKDGSGSGTVVTVSPSTGINCGADCSEPYSDGTTVTLSASPAAGSTFTGWSGDCTGTGQCIKTLTADTFVSATFALTTHQLTVNITGDAGAGTVSAGTGSGINCPGDCSEVYDYGTSVTLTATSAIGYTFTGWSSLDGTCAGAGTGQCIASMTQARTITATFVVQTHTLTVNLASNGAGTVSSNPIGITCGTSTTPPPDCTESYNYNTQVTLTATPSTGTVFNGFSGAGCVLGGTTCIVTMDAAKSVTATFTLTVHTLTVTKTGPGSGAVGSTPGGISCGGTCMKDYNYGQSVTLTATAAAGSSFAGWTSGASCTGTGPCTFTMTAARTVNAQFDTIAANVMFVTAAFFTPGALGGIAGADAACQNAANVVSLAGTYVAYLSSASSNAITRLGTASGWKRVDGKPFANTQADLTNGRLFYPPRITQSNTDVLTGNAVTATKVGGVYDGEGDCSNYSVVSTAITSGGVINTTSMMFTDHVGFQCDTSTTARLYCLGIDRPAVVTVPPVTGTRKAFMRFWTPGGGLTSADNACQSDATANSLPGTYLALLPTTTNHALSRFTTGGGNWVRVDNVAILPTAAAWSTASHFDAPPSLGANGTSYYGNNYNWAGANNFNTVGSGTSTCNNWMMTSGTATTGLAGYTNISNGFLGNSPLSCTFNFSSIVCLQE